MKKIGKKGLSKNAKIAIVVVGSFLGAILVTGGALYAADAGIHATVLEKSSVENWIRIKVNSLLGLPLKVQLDGGGGFAACTMVNKDNHFAYHVRSGDVDIWLTEASWKNGAAPSTVPTK